MEELIVSSVRFLGALPMFVAAACLILFNRGKLQSAVYNRSRWFIAAATLILGIHQEQPLSCLQAAGGHDASRVDGSELQEIIPDKFTANK